MIKIFTENDFLRLVYNEVNDDERLKMNTSIVLNNEMSDIYNAYKYVVDKLDDVVMEAPTSVVEKIKHASRKVQFV